MKLISSITVGRGEGGIHRGHWIEKVTAPLRDLKARPRFVELVEIGLIIALVVGALVVETRGAYWTRLALLVLIYAMAAQGLDLISGYGGQFSLGHSGLFAIGAYASAIAFFTLDWPFLISVPFAVAVSAVGGVFLGGPALRVGGLYLALVTLSFAFIMRNLLNDAEALTQGTIGIGPLNPEGIIESRYLIVCAIALGIVWVLLRRIVRSQWGRVLVSIRESEGLAKAVGVRVWRVKLVAFAVSASATGLAGALYAHQGYISPHNFGWELSLMFLVILFLGGIGTLLGAFLGAVVVIVIPEMLSAQGEPRLIAYGAILIVIMLLAPSGLVGGLRRIRDAFAKRQVLKPPVSRERDRFSATEALSSEGAGAPVPRSSRPETGAMQLSSDTTSDLWEFVAVGVHKRFEGVAALAGVDLRVRPGQLIGLIGPNGSGKTTLLNCMCGQLRVDAGTISLSTRDLTRSDASKRAALGIYRTFQHGALCPSLTLRENVMLGVHRRASFGFVRSMVCLRRRYDEEQATAKRADDILTSLHVAEEYRCRYPDEAPYGIRRLGEIAVALMGSPSVLLLDEPAAGLVEHEIEQLEEILRRLVASGMGIVLVEHHLSMVMRLADQVTVLDSGRAISAGTPTEVAGDPNVQRAYLGKEWQTDAPA